jgi:hydrogenase expression/formation protein HypD
MKYIDEFRDGALAERIARIREAQPGALPLHGVLRRPHARHLRYGVADLLPANVRMIHGPGCPVCVLPIGRIDQAIGWRWSAASSSAPTATHARAGLRRAVADAREARGGDIRMVYSPPTR